MGFFAEGLRESINDRTKAKEYIQSFYDDLRSDTAKISEVLRFDEEKVDGLGNVGNCYDSVLQNAQSPSCMFIVVKNTVSNMPFQITDRTLEQLSNAGGFRLLKKQDADSIIRYVKNFNSIRDFQSTGFQQAQDDVRKKFSQLINVRASLQLLDPELKGELLFSHDKTMLNEYFNDIIRYKAFTQAHWMLLKAFRENQDRLIGYFKSKYNLE